MLFSGKDLTKLLIPLMIEQLLAVAVGMADVVMVAAVGEAAVSGVSLVDSIRPADQPDVGGSGYRRRGGDLPVSGQ